MKSVKNFFAQFNRRELIFLIWIFILSRLIILTIGVVGYTMFPQEGTLLQPRPMHDLVDIKAQWHQYDSGWFEKLAKEGYPERPFSVDRQETWGFLPLYPLVLKTISLAVGPHFFWIGVVVSNTFAFLASLFLYRLMKDKFKQAQNRVITLLLLSAGSFYLSINYAESLFVLLTVLVFYAAHKKNYGWSLLFAGLASVTRIHGVLLLLIPLVELWLQHKNHWRQYLRYLPWLVAAVLPMGILMLYLNATSGEPLAFIKIQEAWRSNNTYPFQGFGVFLTGMAQFKDYVHLLFIGMYVVVYLLARAKMPIAYTIFAIGFLLLSTSNESLYGSTRYVLAALPVFMAAALTNTYIYRTFLYTNIAFLGLSVASFVTATHVFK